MRVGATTIEIQHGLVRTTLPGGAVVYAEPMHDDESVARAQALGYADVLAMTMDHDPLHSRLCAALGLPESPALRGAANGTESEIAGAEECMVLAAQRFLNLCRRAGLTVGTNPPEPA